MAKCQTERHGDIKQMFERARWMHTPSSPVALQRLAMECNAAKNRLSNRPGTLLSSECSGLETVFLRT